MPAEQDAIDCRPILEVKGITKTYGGVVALDDVSLALVPGVVHCLAGENGSGKSTLIKIISGVEQPDSGEIIIDSKSMQPLSPAFAMRAGIQVIYQDFSLFPNLTVTENIGITSAVTAGAHLYHKRWLRPQIENIVEQLGLHLRLDAEVGSISVADRQLTAICRALVQDARVIFMDEPTTALTRTEVKRLFDVVRRLQAKGVALVFVSHKIEEVLSISQEVTVLRNGHVVASGPAMDFDVNRLTRDMTGHEVDVSRVVVDIDQELPPLLEVDNLSLSGAFENITFTVRPGEIVGVTGLLGSGRGEIAEALFGILKAESGEVRVKGEPIRLGSIKSSARAGIGYVPEDRLTQGLFLNNAISDNITASSLSRYAIGKVWLSNKRANERIAHLFEQLRIKAPSVQLPVKALSGGNAQRVVLAKWLATDPEILILNGPTVGVDVGSKAEILELLREAAREGTGVIMISDDIPELVAACNRILIIRQGHVVAEVDEGGMDAESIQEVMTA